METAPFETSVLGVKVTVEAPAHKPGWDDELDAIAGKKGATFNAALSNMCYRHVHPEIRRQYGEQLLDSLGLEDFPEVLDDAGNKVVEALIDETAEDGTVKKVPVYKRMTEAQLINWAKAEGKLDDETLATDLKAIASTIALNAERLASSGRALRATKEWIGEAERLQKAWEAGTKDESKFHSAFEALLGFEFAGDTSDSTQLAVGLRQYAAAKAKQADF